LFYSGSSSNSKDDATVGKEDVESSLKPAEDSGKSTVNYGNVIKGKKRKKAHSPKKLKRGLSNRTDS